ncbi:MAG: hypothetical protein C4583_19355 [Anaerolineaceae bacterium]|nr:MAG: hypothetical protein C4583_19355 [Anaerolineaceae bacterium]
MASASLNLPPDYWQTLHVTPKDIEFLQTYLFEHETPLTPRELVAVLVTERLRAEQEAAAKKQDDTKIFLPMETYTVGDLLRFPAIQSSGRVSAVRAGANPELGAFDVLTVEMDGGARKLFAASLATHKLNDPPAEDESASDLDPEAVARDFGAELETKLDSAFTADDSLVRIAGRWFPRALLLDVNTGHLNLAEAVLDMAGGEPMTTDMLMKDIELPAGVNAKLTEFSLNYALQEDARFDEVGPTGKVLWCLERLEPEGVRTVPVPLQYVEIEHDRAELNDQMLALEAQVDDELSPASVPPADEVTISLLYPHWRAGTLPISARVKRLFPTAYETDRVRFTLVDAKSGKKIPAWVVRKHGYVYGLAEWYKLQETMPGGLIRVRKGNQPGEVQIEALTHRSVRDWVRTVIVGADGGLVFALLKQQISAELNDRMALAVPDPAAVDAARDQAAKSRVPFAELTKNLMGKLMTLSPQGHVHVQELYAAINILRRVPPAPLMTLLAASPEYTHVGDLHFRLEE